MGLAHRNHSTATDMVPIPLAARARRADNGLHLHLDRLMMRLLLQLQRVATAGGSSCSCLLSTPTARLHAENSAAHSIPALDGPLQRGLHAGTTITAEAAPVPTPHSPAEPPAVYNDEQGPRAPITREDVEAMRPKVCASCRALLASPLSPYSSQHVALPAIAGPGVRDTLAASVRSAAGGPAGARSPQDT
jgi:hypothetical protein